jgi:ribokinase
VCVVGSFMMDLSLRAPRRPSSGETVLGTSFEMFLGGKGFNQAIASVRAGSQTAMVGRVGRDEFGERFLDCLRGEGVDVTGVFVDDREGTGVAVPLVDDQGENSIVAVPRANYQVTVDDVDAAGDLIAGCDVMLLQLELPVDTVSAAARVGHDAGVTVVLNPAPAVAAAEAFGGLVDVVVANRAEAAQLTGASITTEPLELALALRGACASAVILTLGEDGAWVVDRDGTLHVAAHAVPVLDTVGAGDAFCGTLAARLARGEVLRHAAVVASAAGALSVTVAGAEPSMPRAADVEALLSHASGTHAPRDD